MESLILRNGKILSGEEISKHVRQIINILAEEEMSVAEAQVVLHEAMERVKEESRVKPISF